MVTLGTSGYWPSPAKNCCQYKYELLLRASDPPWTEIITWAVEPVRPDKPRSEDIASFVDLPAPILLEVQGTEHQGMGYLPAEHR